MPKFIDLSGQKFSRLTVISRAPTESVRVHWTCICICGNTTVVAANKLRNKHTQSCGCFSLQRSSEANFVHGHSCYPNGGKATKEYNTWALMHRRCKNVNAPDFEDYGARGIYVCERWGNFLNFFADMGEATTEKHSIERVNNDGPYSPENCRWATATQQARNKRNSRYIECEGERMTIAEWAERTGINYKRIHKRIASGWSTQRAIFTPV